MVVVPSYHQVLGEDPACLWGQVACQEDLGVPCSCEGQDDVGVHACLEVPSCSVEGGPGAWEVLVDPFDLEI